MPLPLRLGSWNLRLPERVRRTSWATGKRPNEYTLAHINQLAQNSACTRTHEAEQWLARWLLLTHDWVHGASFPISQGFMARMLGVSRPTVSIAASTLQKGELVSYVWGTITVTDRPGLEAVSCGCYCVIRTQFDRLVGGDG